MEKLLYVAHPVIEEEWCDNLVKFGIDNNHLMHAWNPKGLRLNMVSSKEARSTPPLGPDDADEVKKYLDELNEENGSVLYTETTGFYHQKAYLFLEVLAIPQFERNREQTIETLERLSNSTGNFNYDTYHYAIGIGSLNEVSNKSYRMVLDGLREHVIPGLVTVDAIDARLEDTETHRSRLLCNAKS
jgi:hypothetical protein